MGVSFSKVGAAIKRAVSPEAREAHKAQQERVQQRIAEARERVLARRKAENQQQNQQVNELLSQAKDEVALEQSTKLKLSLPNAPRHQIQTGSRYQNRR